MNIPKLRGKIAEKGEPLEKLAVKMGINRATLYRKIADKGENFSIKEADALSEVLDLGLEERRRIFFDRGVARNAKTE